MKRSLNLFRRTIRFRENGLALFRGAFFFCFACLPWFGLHGSEVSGEWMTLSDRAGRTIEVQVLEMDAGTVRVRVAGGDLFDVPLETLDPDSRSGLEGWWANRLARRNQRINEAFGLDLFRDAKLWNTPVESLAASLSWSPESSTTREKSFRAFPLGKLKVLGEPVYSASLLGADGQATHLSLVFLNRADLAIPRGHHLQDLIAVTARNLSERLEALFGKGREVRLGTDRRLREWVTRWDWEGHSFLLSHQEGEFVGLRILPPGEADSAGQADRLRASELRRILETRVTRNDFGDVLLQDLPMVDQGPKGFCVPATFERVLRYLGIPADMYLIGIASLAEAGGTFIESAIEGLTGYIRQHGRTIRDLPGDIRINTIARYVDRGVPIIWLMSSSPSFNQLANQYTSDRNRFVRDPSSPDPFPAAAAPASRLGPDPFSAHACLIVGYNRQRNEVAVSDSWGPDAELRWVPLEAVRRVHMGRILVVDL